MSAREKRSQPLGWNLSDLGQARKQELHEDRIGRLYLGLEGDQESQRRAVARIEWTLAMALPGCLLDIGCSEGILCILAAGRGHAAEGWDLNPSSVEAAQVFAKKMLSGTEPVPQFRVQDIFEATELAPCFDTVVLGEVVEHVYEPEAMIRRAVLALRDGGRLIISTPWGHFPAPDHHQTFTLTSFLATLPEVIRWDHLDVVDGYIRFAGTRALTPGAEETDQIAERNAATFPPSRLLEISERAAVASQHFLHTTLAHRYSMWQTARDAAERHHSAGQEAVQKSERLRAEVARLEDAVERSAAEAQAAANSIAEFEKCQREIAALRAEINEAQQAKITSDERLEEALSVCAQQVEHIDRILSDRVRQSFVVRGVRVAGQALRRRAASQAWLRDALLTHLPDRWILRFDRVTSVGVEANLDQGTGSRVGHARRPPEDVSHVFPSAASTRRGAERQTLNLPRGHDLVLVCGAYPDGSHRYGGEFLRSRVHCYQELGLQTLVVSVHQRHATMDVIPVEGGNLLRLPPDRIGALQSSLRGHVGTPTAVHSPTPEVGRLFLERAAESPTAIFLHGAEARDYRRLHFNFTTDEMELQRKRLDRANAERAGFLSEAASNRRAQLVFVSEYLREIAEADFGLDLSRAHVVHNVIDGQFFAYRKREAHERRRLLLVRSFQQRNYGNDIALRAVNLLLADTEVADLMVTVRGFGRYFRPLTKMLAGRPNVDIEEGYVDARTLRGLHNEHGVYLAPTRHDTQGVSMGEAMASGLVCVTHRVAAIPEFVSDEEAVLVDGESPEAYAAALKKLLEDPGGFLRRSAAAAHRVRRQCGVEATVARELELLGVEAPS